MSTYGSGSFKAGLYRRCAGRRGDEKVKVQDYVTFMYDGKVN